MHREIKKNRKKAKWLQLLVGDALQFSRVTCKDAESDAFNGYSEHISNAALGLYDAGRAGIALELAPEAEDLHVDAAIEDILVNAGCLQKVFSAQWTLRCFEEGEQHRILTLGQRDWGACRIGKLPDPPIKLPAGESKAASLGIANRCCSADIEPSQNRTDARKKFTQIEWLCHVIVGT